MSTSPSITACDRANWRSRATGVLNLLGVYVLVVLLFALGCAVSGKFWTCVERVSGAAMNTMASDAAVKGLIDVGLDR